MHPCPAPPVAAMTGGHAAEHAICVIEASCVQSLQRRAARYAKPCPGFRTRSRPPPRSEPPACCHCCARKPGLAGCSHGPIPPERRVVWEEGLHSVTLFLKVRTHLAGVPPGEAAHTAHTTSRQLSSVQCCWTAHSTHACTGRRSEAVVCANVRKRLARLCRHLLLLLHMYCTCTAGWRVLRKTPGFWPWPS